MNFSQNLSRLRRAHNLSQEELGSLIGVSRQTVSKWETGQSTPEMNRLIALAQLFHCTIEALTGADESACSAGRLSEEALAGEQAQIDNFSYEYRSSREFFGIPLVHISLGRHGRHHAQGIVAIGNTAVGIIAIGFASVGILSIGLACVGLIALGCLCAGTLAAGAIAVGGLALGGIAVGRWAAGGLAIGQIALGGLALGQDFAMGGLACGTIAIGDQAQGAHAYLLNGRNVTWTVEDILRSISLSGIAVPDWLTKLLLLSLR